MPAEFTCHDPAAPAAVLTAALAEQGFLAFPELLSAAEVERARQGLHELTLRIAEEGEFRDRAFHDPRSRCHVQLEPGCDPAGLAPAELEPKVRKLMGYVTADPWFAELAEQHTRLRRLLDAILGPGAILFQDMALVKPAQVGSIKPWHQDNAYFAVAPLEQVLGVWIALDDATVENGCMHVIPGGHRLGPLRHHHDRDCEIVPGRLDPSRAFAVPLPPGGALLFYGMLPHETPPNRSPCRRRALQLHYRGAETRVLSREEYDRLYAEADGAPASCAAARASS